MIVGGSILHVGIYTINICITAFENNMIQWQMNANYFDLRGLPNAFCAKAITNDYSHVNN